MPNNTQGPFGRSPTNGDPSQQLAQPADPQAGSVQTASAAPPIQPSPQPPAQPPAEPPAQATPPVQADPVSPVQPTQPPTEPIPPASPEPIMPTPPVPALDQPPTPPQTVEPVPNTQSDTGSDQIAGIDVVKNPQGSSGSSTDNGHTLRRWTCSKCGTLIESFHEVTECNKCGAGAESLIDSA